MRSPAADRPPVGNDARPTSSPPPRPSPDSPLCCDSALRSIAAHHAVFPDPLSCAQNAACDPINENCWSGAAYTWISLSSIPVCVASGHTNSGSRIPDVSFPSASTCEHRAPDTIRRRCGLVRDDTLRQILRTVVEPARLAHGSSPSRSSGSAGIADAAIRHELSLIERLDTPMQAAHVV